MTNRQRFIETLTFGRPDRVYYNFGLARGSTVEAWQKQGFTGFTYSGEYGNPPELIPLTGQDPNFFGKLPGVELGMYPKFEEQIIRVDEKGRLWRDSMGIVMLDAGENLKTKGFRTRSYISHPVTDRNSWEKIRKRFAEADEGRYPSDWSALSRRLEREDSPVFIPIDGLFWGLRNWVGFEELCMMFYDDPELIDDMMEHLTCFYIDLFSKILDHIELDGVLLNEDMCYKHAPMISPEMVCTYMLPRYKRIVGFLKGKGVPLVAVDSDGHVSHLLDIWVEAGFDASFPIEIAALNDPVEYRKKLGRKLAFVGCIDKREIRTYEMTYREVMSKVPYLLDQGGFIPGIDHAVPPDVPFASYVYMGELIKALAEGRSVVDPKGADKFMADKLSELKSFWNHQTFGPKLPKKDPAD